MPVYNKRGILLLPKVIVLNPKDGGIIKLKLNLQIIEKIKSIVCRFFAVPNSQIPQKMRLPLENLCAIITKWV